jgi:hypothetical protein
VVFALGTSVEGVELREDFEDFFAFAMQKNLRPHVGGAARFLARSPRPAQREVELHRIEERRGTPRPPALLPSRAA